MVVKLDLENAYDETHWDLIKLWLGKFLVLFGENGFLDSLHCHYFIILNSSPKGFISASRRLRQGDRLSPFLFTLVANSLSQIISMLNQKACLKASKLRRIKLMYETYSLRMILWSLWMENKGTTTCLIQCFEKVSGLKINWSNSHLLG